MPAPSPQQPSLGRLRRRARALIRQHQAHDPAAADLLRTHHPAFAGLSTDEILNKPLHLSDAQLALSREEGQLTWPQAGLLPGTPIGKPRVVQELIPRPEYRRELAARRGLPPIGTRQASCHSMEYAVVDYAFVLSQAGIARAHGSEPVPHIDELLPLIDFPKMSPRLLDLYTEVDRCTSKGLLFFDTMPDTFPRQAAPGVHEVRTTQDPCYITFHFDASRLHETIIAHELGHVWVEFVEGCEDWRNLRDQSDISKVVQFQHIQSFALDLKVNALLQSRGFDMSVIDNDQLESIREMALHYAKGDLPRTKRTAAALANTIAAAVLEQQRWPKAVLPSFRTCLATIRAAQPEIYRLAEQFVASVERYGYADRTAIGHVIDECAMLSFQATGDDFDPARDLVEERPTEWMHDKRPEFLPGLPVAAKLEVWKAAARHGLGAHMRWEMGITASGHTEIRLQDSSGNWANPVVFSLDVPLDQLDISPLEQNSVPSTLPPASPQRQLTPSMPSIPPSTGVQLPVLPMSFVSTLTWQSSRRLPATSVFSSGRNYMAGVGLWLSKAGFEEQQIGEHPYGYAFNNPVTNSDPSGEFPVLLVACGIACGCALGMVAECIDDASTVPSGYQLQRFVQCMEDTFNGLPLWGQIAVGGCFVGCLLCAAQALKSCSKLRCKAAIHKSDHYWIYKGKKCWCPHTQLNCFLQGVPGSGFPPVRIPFPPCCNFKNCVPPIPC